MPFGVVVIELRVMRVNADRRINIVVLFRDIDCSPKIVRIRIARTDIQHRRDTGLGRPLNYLVTVAVELFAVDMAV